MLQFFTGFTHTSESKQRRHRTHPPRSHRNKSLFESLERRTLMTSTPIGLVTLANSTQITGWAFNADDAALPVNVEITINGIKTTISANQSLSSLTAKLGSPLHAFSFTVPQLPPGNSTLLIQAVSTTTGLRKTLKSGTLSNPAPTGSVTISKDGTHITGWAHDADTSSPIQVRIDVDGVAGTPFTTTILNQAIANKFKAPASTFGFDVSGTFLGHVVEVFALDAPTGNPWLLYTNNKKAKGKVEVNNGLTVSGWAQDPDNPSASITIRVDVDGVTLSGSPFDANLSRPDLATSLGSPNHGFSVTLAGLIPGKHTVTVYALDGQATSAKPVLLQSKVVTNTVPIGHVDSISSTSITGWALDPDLGATSTTINVYIDDQVFGTFPASVARPDLIGKYHSPNHGFVIDLSGLLFPDDSHSITLTVVDSSNSDEPEVVFYDNFINNHKPIGKVETVDGTSITGWAYDPDALSTGILVDLYVDGVYASTVTADQARPDVLELPDPDHGFIANLPGLSFGTHKIEIYAAESQNNVSVLIGSKTVTNNRPIGTIESASSTTVTGWAADPNRLGESLEIRIYVNGLLIDSGTTHTANISRPDLITSPPLSTFPGYDDYGFSITLSTLVSGTNQVDVYALDLNNNMLSPLGSRIITV